MTALEKSPKKAKKKLLQVQDLKLVRTLAGNNKTTRDRALKSLKKWFHQRESTMPFTEVDLDRIWRGLYYSMWMADKPLVQEECAENIAHLVHFKTLEQAMLFFKVGLQMLCSVWFGIDQHRLDKFLMLVRRLLRQALVVLKDHKWRKNGVKLFDEAISHSVLNWEKEPPLGLFMHFTEIYLEELAKVSEGQIQKERLIEFINPYIKRLAFSSDLRQVNHVKEFIFSYLMRQSNLGIEYEIKYNAWKQQGFPGTINSMVKVKRKEPEDEESDEELVEETDKPLDPRAGRVDVELPQLKFLPKHISEAMLELKQHKNTTTKTRKTLTYLADQFDKMDKKIYPLGVKRIKKPALQDYEDTNIRKAANRLYRFEKEIKEEIINSKKRKGDKVASEENLSKKAKVTNGDLKKFIEKSEAGINLPLEKSLKKSKKLKENITIENGLKVEKKKRKVLESKKVEVTNSKVKKSFEKPIPPEKPIKKIKKLRENTKENELKIIDKPNTNKKTKLAESVAINSELNRYVAKPGFDLNKVDYVIARNSGTWVVFKDENKIESKKKLNKNSQVKEDKLQENVIESKTPSPSRKPKKESPKADNSKDIFPQKSEWDVPLQEGEYEICIPSKKYVQKLKNQEKLMNKSVDDLLDKKMFGVQGKKRFSLDSNLVKNPLSNKNASPGGSAKKVKINTSLNKSQEVFEHHQQILSSPAIPYDANKKPSKPLLKTPTKGVVLNPFYKQPDVW